MGSEFICLYLFFNISTPKWEACFSEGSPLRHGRLGLVFAVAKLPSGKQEKIIALLEAFVDQRAAGS